jgi:hypothetical protein
MFLHMELINMKPTIGAVGRTGHAIFQRYAATCLPGGVEKIRIQKQDSATWLMPVAASSS